MVIYQATHTSRIALMERESHNIKSLDERVGEMLHMCSWIRFTSELKSAFRIFHLYESGQYYGGKLVSRWYNTNFCAVASITEVFVSLEKTYTCFVHAVKYDCALPKDFTPVGKNSMTSLSTPAGQVSAYYVVDGSVSCSWCCRMQRLGIWGYIYLC